MENTEVEQQNETLFPKYSAEETEKQINEEYQTELEKIEEEIITLKQVLTAKEQRASELRKLLGINTLTQLKAELNKVHSSQAFQKTSETLKSARQATASVFTSFGNSMSNKFSEMKNSNTFKSFEEKVEGMGSTIMAKVQGVREDEEEDVASNTTSHQPVVDQPQKVEGVEDSTQSKIIGL